MLRHLLVFLTLVFLAIPVMTPAQEPQASAIDRSATGGAQTLEDILRRQKGELLDDRFRSENIGGNASSVPSMGPVGGASDPDLWRALRYNEADVRVSTMNEVGKVLIQDGGIRWYNFRKGPLATYGGFLLLGTIAAMALFYVLRGRVKVDEPMTGRTVTRFASIERFTHWLLAGSFLLLGATGLLVLFGRWFIVPVFGHEANSGILTFSKFVHNNVAWAFMLAVILVFVFWVRHNIPNRTDITWFLQFGGIIGKNHPPAKKFNAGQKIIFWSVVLFGSSISISGLSLLFPFDIALFGKTFGIINDIGVPGWLGLADLPTALAPQEEMQLAQLWHAIMAFILMSIIIAHIYIGSIGMEGAYDAMGTGEVDEAWAHQHHSIWLDEVKAAEAAKAGQTTPAE